MAHSRDDHAHIMNELAAQREFNRQVREAERAGRARAAAAAAAEAAAAVAARDARAEERRLASNKVFEAARAKIVPVLGRDAVYPRPGETESQFLARSLREQNSLYDVHGVRRTK